MKEYDHLKLEKKWQKIWEEKGIYHAQNGSKKKKFYSLIEFPYPSGAGMHVGHIRSNTAMDIISRKRRMEGFNVLYPIGWDAFGLPTENYAIKTGIHPIKVTKTNTDTFRRQLKSLGFSFDWSREVNTTDPKYYKWTQWIFLQFFKKGLAYKSKTEINWCPNDKIGLANEEVIGGNCERCGSPVEKREKEQWMLAITKYADRLDKDLDTVDYLEKIKIQQRNWIGKSEGAEIEFRLTPSPSPNQGEGGRRPGEVLKVFTTRPDTIFGATYLVLSPEHVWVTLATDEKHDILENKNEVIEYLKKVKQKTEIERTSDAKEKTGVELKGVKAINPATKEEIPIWVADYVLAHYGTGAIMAVPAHDERDFEFAKKYGLPIKQVIAPHMIDKDNSPVEGKKTVPREVVQIVVKHWSENKVIRIAWKNAPYKSFVIGGREEGESWEEAAKRETVEETGYKDFKSIKRITPELRSEWYAGHKNENRYAMMNIFFVELGSPEREEMSEDEKAKHDVEWVSFKDIPTSYHPVSEMDYIWKGLNEQSEYIYTGTGTLIYSGKFSEMDSEKAKKEIIKFVNGREKTTFKLRDWVFSRQRYWGEPIPLINCPKCALRDPSGQGFVPVPEKDLPVVLPKVAKYKPTDNGESPLADMKSWVHVKCPQCKGAAKRETDTMPNWAGSSWYFLRYTDPKNNKEFASKKNLQYWTPIDWYNGGMEHTTLHLLYSRFWHKFLYDLKLVPTSEPYMKRTSHGMILAEQGEKMSKSKGNTVNPDDLVKIFGADTLRLYEMFMGPFDQSVSWNTDSMVGPRRFLERVWKMGIKLAEQKNSPALAGSGLGHGSNFSVPQVTKLLHKTIKKVSEDIEEMRFNTAISSMMVLVNEMEKTESVSKEDFKKFLQILSPFAPHIAEELWNIVGEKKSISVSSWPEWDKGLIKDEEVKIAVQINGKVRAEILITADSTEDDIKKQVLGSEAIQRHIKNSPVKKVIYVKNRLINIVL